MLNIIRTCKQKKSANLKKNYGNGVYVLRRNQDMFLISKEGGAPGFLLPCATPDLVGSQYQGWVVQSLKVELSLSALPKHIY